MTIRLKVERPDGSPAGLLDGVLRLHKQNRPQMTHLEWMEGVAMLAAQWESIKLLNNYIDGKQI